MPYTARIFFHQREIAVINPVILLLLADFKLDLCLVASGFFVINMCRFIIYWLREFLISEPLDIRY